MSWGGAEAIGHTRMHRATARGLRPSGPDVLARYGMGRRQTRVIGDAAASASGGVPSASTLTPVLGRSRLPADRLLKSCIRSRTTALEYTDAARSFPTVCREPIVAVVASRCVHLDKLSDGGSGCPESASGSGGVASSDSCFQGALAFERAGGRSAGGLAERSTIAYGNGSGWAPRPDQRHGA